jgi:hypothetical protein
MLLPPFPKPLTYRNMLNFYNFAPGDNKRSDIIIHHSEQTVVPGEISH